jgi:hypothetical protein
VVGPGGPFGPCCRVSVAFCATAAGKIGATEAVAALGPVDGVPALFAPDWLITLLMAVALWMLAKTMLLGGAATYAGERT